LAVHVTNNEVLAVPRRDSAVRPALQIRNLSKSFPGTLALAAFDLEIMPGEVHVLVGANGSGKSTLIKVLSGFHTSDQGGEVLVDGEPMPFGSGDHSYRLGCRFVHQDLGLIPTMSVQDNLHLGRFPTRAATIRPRAMRDSARSMLAQVGLELDPAAQVCDLGAAKRTGVALARAVRADRAHPPKLLVLDEPTATLPSDEVDHLLDMVRAAASRGVAVLFVTHHLDEVFRIADSVTVLRDGRIVGRSRIDKVQRRALVELLAGGEIDDVHRADDGIPTGAAQTALVVNDLWAGTIRGLSFSVAQGEVIGIAGLTGSGRETALGAIFGAEPRSRGTVTIGGTSVPARRPDLAMAAGAGLLPGERKTLSGIMSLSARENLSIGSLAPFWSKLRLNIKKEKCEAAGWFEELGVRPPGAMDMELIRFSGGNQQKILFAKWIRRRPAVFLLDEPTQGVDIGAKAELHRQLLAAAASGTAVVISSTDTEELVSLCSRVLVLRNGALTDELTGPRITVGEITKSVMSEPTPTPGVRGMQ
jgi:ribose transport system ATP-binding protein